MEKVIVTCAITGGASPAGNPYLPKSPSEQVTSAVEAFNAGASVIHIHGRNPETGMADHDARFIADAVAPIKQQCPGVIINVSTGGSGKRYDGDHLFEEIPKESVKGRISVIAELSKRPETKPDLASFNAGSPVIDIYSRSQRDWLLKFVMVHTFNDMAYMAQVMYDSGVKPEFECYDVGMINNVITLRDLGYVHDSLYFQCVMGVMGCIPATPDNLLHMVRQIPREHPWSVCAVGAAEYPMVAMGLVMGGNVRVGFEDNIYLNPGVQAKSNAEMVEKAVRLARELGREVASPEEARAILGLAG
ncbi:MAG TPA: 3-keto-5-aminohexanoate cleavage protein [Thermoleophilia bacterium]|nr:3-keto-5-aminohexanoate cleavage protein [Thermoleophilia bacterium]